MSAVAPRVKVGVVGGSGYTGVELLRLLADHPSVELAVITSRGEAGTPVDAAFPSLRGHVDLCFTEPDAAPLSECAVVFFATPHGTAMQVAPGLLAAGVRVIDLSADFRLRSPASWERWYGMPHAAPEWLAEAVYGLPEHRRERIREARLVANPGCYPTAVQLGLLPLLEAGLVRLDSLVADAKSGVSGAGRHARIAALHAEVGENFAAYGVDGHRHLPEIEQELAAVAGAPVEVCFVPHLVPMVRGIEATLYAELRADLDAAALHRLYAQRYAAEPFVDVLPPGGTPDTRSVRGANTCRIGTFRPAGSRRVVVSAVIDNLVKGAAGQAVQNMNLLCGFPEAMGLGAIPLWP